MRKSIDGLAGVVEYVYEMNPYQKNILFLFCGRSNYKIKGLLWEENGFVLIHKRLAKGRFQWIRDSSKGLVRITYEQYYNLMNYGKLDQQTP